MYGERFALRAIMMVAAPLGTLTDAAVTVSRRPTLAAKPGTFKLPRPVTVCVQDRASRTLAGGALSATLAASLLRPGPASESAALSRHRDDKMPVDGNESPAPSTVY
jgi:hypothetical protein